MKRTLFVICAVVLPLGFTAQAQGDLKMVRTSRMNVSDKKAAMKDPRTGKKMDIGKLPVSTVYLKGPRMLTEMRIEKDGFRYIYSRLRQCDQGRELNYGNTQRKYTATYFTSNPDAKDKQGGGTVTYVTTYNDTGESQPMLGYTARRVKSVTTVTPGAGACLKNSIQIETDGWYVDLPEYSGATFSSPEPPSNTDAKSCHDKIIYEVNGKAENGFAIKETTTMTTNGMEPVSMIHEVVEIGKTELEISLFDPPKGYNETADSATDNAENARTASDQSSRRAAGDPESIARKEDALQMKRSGVVRIGIAKPQMKMPDSKTDQTAPLQLSAAVRDALVETLKSETVEAIRLSTDAPEAEARQKECDYVFYSNVEQKHGGGGFGGFMKEMAIGAALEMIPGVGGVIAGVAGGVVTKQMGKAAKAKDEFTFDYKVTDMNSAVLSQALSKAKTKKAGEDVLSPQIVTASNAVLGEIAKKGASSIRRP